jgi:hypothetical protein
VPDQYLFSPLITEVMYLELCSSDRKYSNISFSSCCLNSLLWGVGDGMRTTAMINVEIEENNPPSIDSRTVRMWHISRFESGRM